MRMKVMCGVLQTRIGKTLATQAATVAFTTGKTLLSGLIAGDGNGIVYPQRNVIRGVCIVIFCPSTPARVARLAIVSNAAMYSGRQSG
jgi:hypothetical protein